MQDLVTRFGFREPDRGDLESDHIVWRRGKPDYTRANYQVGTVLMWPREKMWSIQFLRGKTQNHAAGSLEETVENLVKTWEAQASHFQDFSQWTTVDHSNYLVAVNGGEEMQGSEAYEIGNYNALMKDCPAYQKCKHCSNCKCRRLFL